LPIYDASWPPQEHPVVAYVDADLAGDLDDRKSTSGYLIYAYGILISWRSKKQTLVAQSTMEAELIATATALRAVNWMTSFLAEINDGDSASGISSLLYNDDQACMTGLQSRNFKTDNRHLRVRYYSIYEAIAKNNLLIKHLAGEEMLADAPTKALDGTKNRVFVARMEMT
jgi:hypothetical protein